jgi:sigma-B regulation protein RsbU (phosphoserine phosphatase)
MALLKKKALIREQIQDITSLVAGNLSLQEVLDKLAEAAVEIIGVSACSIRLLDPDTGDLSMRSTYGLSDAYRGKGPVTTDDPVIREAFEGKAVVIDDMRNDSRVKYPIATSSEGLVSQLTVAMVYKDKKIGVLRLYSGKAHHFSDTDVTVTRLIASQCAIAISNARLYNAAVRGAQMEDQMRLASVVQRRMLPLKAPVASGFDISTMYRPCFKVGGDLYDFMQIDNNSFVVIMADVIGKGIPAAIMMGMVKGALRAYLDCMQTCDRYSLEGVIDKMNKFTCEQCSNGEFVTIFIGIINASEKTLRYCNCGHEPTVLIRDGEISELIEGGMVLGVEEDAKYQIATMPLERDDMLLFYTDGLIDAVNFDNKIWGRKRLYETLAKCDKRSAKMFISTLMGYRRRFTGLSPQQDDTSIVAIKVTQ